jgi:hypothetical protein
VSARFSRAVLPFVAAAIAATTFALPARALAADGQATPARSAEWWLSALSVPKAWQDAPGQGAGITVAVLSTGVDATHPDLAGDVTTGPDFSGSRRTEGGAFWGFEGTAVASLIAGHGHGSGGSSGITGIAPHAKILSVRVTLEYDDPLNSDAAITRNLPGAIADGIRYAVSHGAQVIALPLDPGTFGPAATGDPAAAGGSQAEREAVSYALAHNVVLVAPAGDNGESTNAVNYPASYPGVIAVGATGKSGGLAPFTNTRSYVGVTAPGASVPVAAPGGGYGTLSSTDMSSALTAGVAALIRSRFPRLSAAETARVLEGGTTPVSDPAQPGDGHGEISAAGALSAAATANAALPPVTRPSPAPSGASRSGGQTTSQAAPQGGSGTFAGSVLRDVVIGAGGLILILGGALALVQGRRRRAARHAAATAYPAQRGGSHTRRAIEAARSAASNAASNPALGRMSDVVLHGTAFSPRLSRAASRVRSGAYPPGLRVIPLTAAGSARQARRDAGRPPWELSQELAPLALPAGSQDRQQSNTGPMYVWNPASSSGPFPAAGGPGGQAPPSGGRPGATGGWPVANEDQPPEPRRRRPPL